MGERRLTDRETDSEADRQRPYREDRDSKADRCSKTEKHQVRQTRDKQTRKKRVRQTDTLSL